MSEMSWRTPVLRLGAIAVAFVTTVASVSLVVLNGFFALLACGDDGSLDYGTGGDAVRSYCHTSFNDDGGGGGGGFTGGFSGVFTSLSLLALTLAGVTGVRLAVTRRPVWLCSALTLLLLLGAWDIWLLSIG
jgi:hypothetical protein